MPSAVAVLPIGHSAAGDDLPPARRADMGIYNRKKLSNFNVLRDVYDLTVENKRPALAGLL
jgi:hypothetical protein